MRKVPTLFVRDPDDRSLLLRKVNPDCAWVTDGLGAATQKLDGTCVWHSPTGAWWARREVKPGKTPPDWFIPVETDPETAKTVGWEPITGSGFHRWWVEATHGEPDLWVTGTYELVGPKINGNPERLSEHRLFAHDDAPVLDAPRDYDGLAAWLAGRDVEGIVWHGSDGKYAKVKARDFGLPRGDGTQVAP